jgi:hypothetical protein
MTDPSSKYALLTKAHMDECFLYEDGILIWRIRPLHHFCDVWRQRIFTSRQSGKEAGTIIQGYKIVRFSWGRVGVHRIVFLMHNGYLPKEVDHINGIPSDNRIENLRASSHSENLRNMKTPTSNTSGKKGVYFHKHTKRWAAQIHMDGKWKHLGLFKTFTDATKRREDAEIAVYGEFANER